MILKYENIPSKNVEMTSKSFSFITNRKAGIWVAFKRF